MVFVARLDPLKGHDIALKALARAVKKCPSLKLLIVGDGSFSSARQGLGLSKADVWRQRLLNLIDELRLEGHVIFTGYLNALELGCAYTRADFTILTSRAEGFGLVVAEAWHYGKPIIVSSTAGVAELVDNGRTGFVVNPFDVEMVAQAMVRLALDEKLRNEMGLEGQRQAEMLSIERGLKEELEVLQRVLGDQHV